MPIDPFRPAPPPVSTGNRPTPQQELEGTGSALALFSRSSQRRSIWMKKTKCLTPRASYAREDVKCAYRSLISPNSFVTAPFGAATALLFIPIYPAAPLSRISIVLARYAILRSAALTCAIRALRRAVGWPPSASRKLRWFLRPMRACNSSTMRGFRLRGRGGRVLIPCWRTS